MSASSSSPSPCEHLFVYGTLRRAFEIAPVAVIAGGAVFAGMARYRGRLYDLAAR